MNKTVQKIIIYTDGACFGNPGPGGLGIVMKYGRLRKEISMGYFKTTNNRMELLAAITALETLKRNDLEVEIVSDSEYVVNAINKGWLFNWEKKGFSKTKNPDLWKRFLSLYRQNRVSMKWVEGHAGHIENEKCDQLAKSGAAFPTMEDNGFHS